MPTTPPNTDIQFWFNNLSALQSACNSTAISKLDRFQFANSNIVASLPSATQQKTFLTSVKALTGYDNVAPADLTGFKTFEGLLDQKWNYLPTAIATALQSFAPSTLQGGAGADFWNATVGLAFPGGSGGTAWIKARACLVASMPPECFTVAFQAQVDTIVDTPTNKVSDLIPQIAVLG
jgi:hypothetical protein